MTHHEFKRLAGFQQDEIINKYGILCSERVVSGNHFYLYLINYFYVELLHDLSGLEDKDIVIVNVFEDSRQIGPYQNVPQAYSIA